MRIQGIVFSCGCRSTFRTSADRESADRAARILGRHKCHQCDSTQESVVFVGLDRIASLLHAETPCRGNPEASDNP